MRKRTVLVGGPREISLPYGLSTAMILVAHPPIENSDAVAETQSMAWSVICGARHACNNRRRHILQ